MTSAHIESLEWAQKQKKKKRLEKEKGASLCSDLVQPCYLKEDQLEEGGEEEGEDIQRCVIQMLRLESLKVSKKKKAAC